MSGVKVALAASLTTLAAAVGVVLSQSPVTVLASNSVPTTGQLTSYWRRAGACQGGEQLPQGTLAIRLGLGAITGPGIAVEVVDNHGVVSSGERGPGWTGRVVTVSVRPLARTVSDAKICFASTSAGEGVAVYGSATGEAAAARTTQGRALKGRMTVEYLGRGHSSWLSLASSVASHMALGRAWSGTWVIFLVAILMLAAVAAASRLIVRELDR
jgi:hypothetical protein